MSKANPFRYLKTPPEIIRLAVMMYVRFPLSLRNVGELMHERAIDARQETVRYWWNRFGSMSAAQMGNGYMRRLLVLRATSVSRSAETTDTQTGAWVRSLLERKPARFVTVAIANKTAHRLGAARDGRHL